MVNPRFYVSAVTLQTLYQQNFDVIWHAVYGMAVTSRKTISPHDAMIFANKAVDAERFDVQAGLNSARERRNYRSCMFILKGYYPPKTG